MGENPLHYYLQGNKNLIIAANNIFDIKNFLEEKQYNFCWDRVRAVHNNCQVLIDKNNFLSIEPQEIESSTPLQDMFINHELLDLKNATRELEILLIQSTKERLTSIDSQQNKIGLLLSGGLDSISVAYFLKKGCSKEIIAFTLKSNKCSDDVKKSRLVCEELGITLIEVDAQVKNQNVVTSTNYNQRNIIFEEGIEDVIIKTLELGNNPLKDNVFCGVSMYLIGKVIQALGIKTVFCGEGPNEMINDYGFIPSDYGYEGDNPSLIQFREALTFGLKKTDRQLGRGGLAKHAAARMYKIFSFFNIRLESPYFEKNIARILTNIPHAQYDHTTIKGHIIGELFNTNKKLYDLVRDTEKQKFQDGSGISNIFSKYDQKKLKELFSLIYGIRK